MRGRGLRESRWDSAEMVFAGLMPDYMYLIVATADLEKHGPYYYPFQEGMRRLSGCRGKPLLYSLSNYSYSKPMQPIGYLLLPRRHRMILLHLRHRHMYLLLFEFCMVATSVGCYGAAYHITLSVKPCMGMECLIDLH